MICGLYLKKLFKNILGRDGEDGVKDIFSSHWLVYAWYTVNTFILGECIPIHIASWSFLILLLLLPPISCNPQTHFKCFQRTKSLIHWFFVFIVSLISTLIFVIYFLLWSTKRAKGVAKVGRVGESEWGEKLWENEKMQMKCLKRGEEEGWREDRDKGENENQDLSCIGTRSQW